MSITYQPKHKKRARVHGFLVRRKSPTGRRILLRRARKGRYRLALLKKTR